MTHLAPNPSKTTVHMIAQAHLDPVWLWPWTEGRAEALATSRSAADRLSEYPDFQFVRGEAQVYRWIEQEDPTLFAEIRARIAEGRWHVVNGMVVQPDLNIPQGEAILRQFLLGMAYMRDRLGVTPRIGYCVDSFGHPGALPLILRGCGFDSYVFMRPGPHEKELPSGVFWWEAPDGSRVLAFRIAGAYTTRQEADAAHIARSVAAKPAQLADTMCFFGVGNHGGGPTKAQIENVRRLAQESADLDIRFSNPQAYFDAVRGDAAGLPVVRDELQPHAVGCYSANSALKRAYRLAECRLLAAERVAALAACWLGRPAPQEALHALWWDLCFNQFHDTLCGTATKEGSDDAIMALGRVALGAQELANDAARAVAATVDTSGPGGAVLIFNPGAEPYSGYVEYEPWTDWSPWSARWQLVDESGTPVPHQVIETHEALSNADGGPDRLVFPVTLPPMGYRLYRFYRDELANAAQSAQASTPADSATDSRLEPVTYTAADTIEPAKASTPVDPAPDWRLQPVTHLTASVSIPGDGAYLLLENDRLTVRLDPATGHIVACVDRATGMDLAGAGEWNVPLVLEDHSDTWSHDVRRFETVIGRFGSPRITAGDRGPLQASLLVERSYEGNTWLQQLVLRAGEPELLIRNWLHWRGEWRMLKLAFDVATRAPRAFHDTPFAATERTCDGHEVPTQMWLDVSGPVHAVNGGEVEAGLAIINDGKYGCDVTGSMARLTVLRCPPYAYHQPHQIGSRRRYDWLDQGLQEFSVLLRPHIGGWRDASVVRRAREFNLPPLLVTSHAHPGPRPPVDSLLGLDAPDLELTAFKPAETGRGYVVRIADRHGRGGRGRLTWAGRAFSVSLAPGEVRTYLLRPWGRGRWRCVPCDMLERPLGEG